MASTGPSSSATGEWLGKALQAELGDSYRQKRPVTTVIFERLPVTLTLGGLAFGLAVPAAVPLGIAAGLRPNSWIDRLALGIAIVGQAMPSFWFALIGIVVFGVTLRWPPVSGSSTWAHFVLPAVVLAYYATPTLMRLTRAGIPNYKRTNVVMSVSGEPGAAYESYLRATDALFDSAGGRPHWGKLHFMTPIGCGGCSPATTISFLCVANSIPPAFSSIPTSKPCSPSIVTSKTIRPRGTLAPVPRLEPLPRSALPH